MRRFGITAVFPGKNLSKACKYHKKHPYLLRNKVIRYPNQVWSTDITYIKLPTGNVYLMAIIDWFSRKVLSWRVFNTMDALQYANLLGEQSKNTAVLQSSTQTREASLHRMFLYQSLDYNVPDEMYKCFQYNELERKQAA